MPLQDITNTGKRPGDSAERLDASSEGRKRRRSARLRALELPAGSNDDTDSDSGPARERVAPSLPRLDLDTSIEDQLARLVSLIRAFRASAGFQPSSWQLEAALRLLHGWDGLVSAATGFGKSPIWEMVALAAPDSTILVVCPLLALEADQLRKYRGTQLQAVSLGEVATAPLTSGSSSSNKTDLRRQHVRDCLIRQRPNLVFASPETLIDNPVVRSVLKDESFRSKLLAIVVDEAHIVQTWGLTPAGKNALPFRPAFSKIQTLRARLGSHLPVLAVSATLPQSCVQAVLALLDFGHRNIFAIDAGVERANVAYALLPLSSPVCTYEDLLRLFPSTIVHPQDIPKTLIYMPTRASTYEVAQQLQDRFAALGPSFRDAVRPFTSLSSASYKSDTLLRAFCAGGPTRVLVATEAAGLGLDIPDIARVVQYTLPHSLLDPAQHFGREMRSKDKPALAILLAQPWTVLDTADQPLSTAQQRRSDLDKGLQRITIADVCMRTTLVQGAGLGLDRVRKSLPLLREVDGGLATLEEQLTRLPLTDAHHLALSEHSLPPAAPADFCCTSCSPRCRKDVLFSPPTDTSSTGRRDEDRSSRQTARVPSAPPAHRSFLPAQRSLKTALDEWLLQARQQRLVSSHMSSRALLPAEVGERLLASSSRFLATYRRGQVTTSAMLQATLGSAARFVVSPAVLDALASVINTWTPSFARRHTELMEHISSSGAYLDNPAPRSRQATQTQAL
ncbi:hypothetical protein V8E36_006195 [Tilletia maclaganii]